MIYKRFLSLLLVSILFAHFGQTGIHAYRVQKVLGVAGEVTYTYVVRARPIEVTQAPTATSAPIQAMVINSPTPTKSASSSVSSSGPALGAPDMQVAGDQGQGGSGDSSSSNPSVPTLTPTPTIAWCGNFICYTSQICYQNVCRERCDASGGCLGAYHCVSGACVPNTGTSYSSVAQAPTATPYPGTNNTTNQQPDAPYTPSPTPTRSVAAQAPSGPTNTPYPTRTPVNQTFYNNTGNTSSIVLPTPTPIPEALRGKTSTIVVEMPSPTPDPANPRSPVPAPTPLILKGEDMKVIKIGLAKSESPQQTTDGSPSTGPIQDLDITIEAKQGSGVAISQQEFVIQKGVQMVTISANENKTGTLVIEKNDTKARITMPLSIDPTTNIMTVDTPQGPMKVSIMPDDALAIIRQLKVVDKNKTPSDIVLETNEGELQYKVTANKEEKLLWVLPLSIPREVYVAADTGSLLGIKQTPLWDFITLFTF